MNLDTFDALHGSMPKLKGRTICFTPKACEYALRVARTSVFAATDIETIPYKKPAGKKNGPLAAKPEQTRVFMITVVAYTFLLPTGEMESFAFPMTGSKDAKSGPSEHFETIYATIREINSMPQIRWTLHNGVYDCAWFIYYNLPLANYAYDSMSMFWSRWPDLPKRLDYVSSILLNDYKYWKGERKSDNFIEYMAYAMSDTESTLQNTIILARYMLIDGKMRKNFFHAHMRCMTGLAMSALGMAVDEDIVDELAEKLEIEAKEKLEKFRYVVGSELFNPNSPLQRKTLLYQIFGVRMRGSKGRYVSKESDASTGAIALRAIRNEHPLFRRVINALLDAIGPAKQISNVIKMPRLQAGWSGSRLMTSYDGVGTTTTRYASRASALGHGSNVQNIRKKYRQFAMADRDSFILEIDLSAADDVFVAFESGEQKKIDLVRSGKDTHATNACIFFTNWTYDRIVDGKRGKDDKVVHPITGIRQVTKKVVHGCHYLMAGTTLLMSAGREAIVAAAKEVGFGDADSWPQEKLVDFCERLDSAFRRHYPRFQREHDSSDSWYAELRKEVVETGGFRTAFDFFQRFLSDPHDDSTLRAVAATAGQGGTAGKINTILDELVHGYIPLRFRDGPNPDAGATPNRVSEVLNGTTVRLQTHDSAAFNVNTRHRNWRSAVNGIFKTFQRPVYIKGQTFVVGLEADASIYWAHGGISEVKTPEAIIAWAENNFPQAR